MWCWEAIAENLSNAGFSWGCSSEIDSTGRVIFTADAYSRDGRRFTVLSDEKLSAFLELERVTGGALGTLTASVELESATRADGKFDLELGLRFNVGYSSRAAGTRPYDY